jgi:hypothetical protein
MRVAVSRILAGALKCDRPTVALALGGIGLFLNERTLKDRSGIKACVIGALETPSVFNLFLNWQVNQ